MLNANMLCQFQSAKTINFVLFSNSLIYHCSSLPTSNHSACVLTSPPSSLSLFLSSRLPHQSITQFSLHPTFRCFLSKPAFSLPRIVLSCHLSYQNWIQDSQSLSFFDKWGYRTMHLQLIFKLMQNQSQPPSHSTKQTKTVSYGFYDPTTNTFYELDCSLEQYQHLLFQINANPEAKPSQKTLQ